QIFLAALSLEAFENVAVREEFFSLATSIVLARIRATGSSVTIVQRDPAPAAEANPHAGLPCWACTSPIAADVRSQLRSSAASDTPLTPSGLPMSCCRVTAVGSFGPAGKRTHAPVR